VGALRPFEVIGRHTRAMGAEQKADLQRYLTSARQALLWKLDGLSAYDVRRPMTPTGTNLLGLVKHLATVELEYFGPVFNRPSAEPLPWSEENAEPNADLWATVEQSRQDIVDLYLGAAGYVPWWGEGRREVTLHRILVHVIAETHRHAGHADILRELIDGSAGLRAGNENMPPVPAEWWGQYRRRLEQAAQDAAGAGPARSAGDRSAQGSSSA
jgi:uncharacterized damage-inducible protein DinB